MAWYHIEVLYLYPIHTYSLLISLFYEEVGKVDLYRSIGPRTLSSMLPSQGPCDV